MNPYLSILSADSWHHCSEYHGQIQIKMDAYNKTTYNEISLKANKLAFLWILFFVPMCSKFPMEEMFIVLKSMCPWIQTPGGYLTERGKSYEFPELNFICILILQISMNKHLKYIFLFVLTEFYFLVNIFLIWISYSVLMKVILGVYLPREGFAFPARKWGLSEQNSMC